MLSMKFSFCSLVFFLLQLLCPIESIGQQVSLLQGMVKDSETSEILVGAAVYWQGEENTGVVSVEDGTFLIRIGNLPKDLAVSYIGYEKKIIKIDQSNFQNKLEILLQPTAQGLEEVVIEGEREASITESTDLGKSNLPISTLENIPSLFGEVDILRSLQLLPGIQTAGEGTTGLFVRGGSSDQNLIQLDGAPVYNPSHFFGFFSVFNPDALDGVELYKGNIPARFGGRLSSVVDVGMKEGNTEKVKGKGSIGTISSKLATEGPLFSNKSSFVVSGRRTYADLFLKLSNNDDISNNKLYFYDLAGKLMFRLSDSDKLTFSSYYGRDYLEVNGLFGFGWRNWLNSLVWKKTFNDKMYLDVNGYYSEYSYLIRIMDEENGFRWSNLLSEGGLKGLFAFRPHKALALEMGIHSKYFHFFPVDMKADPGSKVDPITTHPGNALQNDVFVSAEIDPLEKLKLELGMRMSFYAQIGQGAEYVYDQEPSNGEDAIVDTLYYGRFDLMKGYRGLEPRLALRYSITDDLSFKASFNRNYQYVQVASNNSAGLPIDRWVLASSYIHPIRGDHFSAGLYKTFDQRTWELSLEGYYKDYKNIIDVKQGGDVLFTDNIEAEVLTGDAWSYGAELLFKKKFGTTTGWFGYTYSRTFRQVPGISEGDPYNPRYDRPHDLSLVLHHEFSERLSGNLSFVYATGQAVSFPVGAYSMDNQEIPYYGPKRNEDRFPNYHRMDASITLKNKDKGKSWRGSWDFSVYNLYGRKNPFSYQFTDIINNNVKYDSSSGDPVYSRRPGVIMTYLFAFLPSVSYNFEF